MVAALVRESGTELKRLRRRMLPDWHYYADCKAKGVKDVHLISMSRTSRARYAECIPSWRKYVQNNTGTCCSPRNDRVIHDHWARPRGHKTRICIDSSCLMFR